MTNEQPNTRAGEALKPCLHCGSANIEFMASATGRSSDRAMCGNCGMQGPISSWNTRPQPELEWLGCNAGNTRHLPQPSELGTSWQSAVEETDRLERELDLTNVDHIALWLEANAISPPLTHQLGWVACRIAEAYEAQVAKLQADGDKLAGALRGLVDSFEKHRPKQLWDNARQALTEWKDRA